MGSNSWHLHRKETGHLLLYGVDQEKESPLLSPLFLMQTWGLPIPPTLHLQIQPKKHPIEELKEILFSWIEKQNSASTVFSLSLHQKNSSKGFVLRGVGLCPETLFRLDNPFTQKIYWQTLASLLQDYGVFCLQMEKEEFELMKERQRIYEGAQLDFDLSLSALEEFVERSKSAIEKKQQAPFSYNPIELFAKIITLSQAHLPSKEFFFNSSNEEILITVQAHPLSTLPAQSGEIVLYTEDPLSHKKEWTGEFHQSYEKFLSSIYTIHPLSQTARLRYGYMEESFEEMYPKSYRQLATYLTQVPAKSCGYWKLTADYQEEQIVFSSASFLPTSSFKKYRFSTTTLHAHSHAIRIPALCASLGYGKGKLALSENFAFQCQQQKIPYILLSEILGPTPPPLPYCAGLLLTKGGMTSPHAEMAREKEIPALLKTKSILFLPDKKELFLGGYKIKEGQVICLDTSSQAILLWPQEISNKVSNLEF